jgi:pimeloyl-ACP methyl ester carboxylesterase
MLRQFRAILAAADWRERRFPMKSLKLARVSVLAVFALAMSVPLAAQDSRIAKYKGTFPDGAKYLIEVPRNWNGTFLLYSHGYDSPGGPYPADDGNVELGDIVHSCLLSHGYALGGSSYATAGYAIQSALSDQILVLDTFTSLVAPPNRTIAWGQSLGGGITAGLVQKHPSRFSGAIVLSGIVAGSVGIFNQWLDSAFALNTLLASGQLQVVNITHVNRDLKIASEVLTEAQTSPQGRARIDLVAALSDLPGWTDIIDPNPPEPSPTDYAAREANNYVSLQNDIFFYFLVRQDMETHAGGNPSWNKGVSYRRQLEHSVDYEEVKALYAQAGIDLDADLNTLDKAVSITADPGALSYLTQYITFDGDLDVPMLALHTSGDDILNVQVEQAYAAVVRDQDDSKLLRERFVHRAGHVNFTAAEVIAALQALIQRLDTGKWQDIRPEDLNKAASDLGPTYNVLLPPFNQSAPPAFINYKPAPFLRRFDSPNNE